MRQVKKLVFQLKIRQIIRQVAFSHIYWSDTLYDILASDLNTIDDTELNKTTIAAIDNTTIAISNSTDEDSHSNDEIHIQFEQHQIQEVEPKEETTSKSIQYFPCITVFLLSFLLL